MNVVDSSAWLEYFANGPNASFFSGAVEATDELIVPTISLYEVFKRVCQQRTADDALHAIALMQQGRVVDLGSTLSLNAVRLSIEHTLPMAGSMILATAQAFEATLWTQDAEFKGLPGVRYRKARR